MEILHIDDFAGLKDVRIEVAPITVLIGSQATGKSIVSKLLFFFREVIWKMDDFAGHEKIAESYKEACQQRFTRYFPQATWGDGAVKITYSVGEHQLSISILERDGDESRKVRLGWSKVFRELFAMHEDLFAKAMREAQDEGEGEKEADMDDLTMDFFGLIFLQLGSAAVVWPQFIPAGRAFFSQVQSTIFRTLEADAEIDPFLISFGATLERTRRQLQRQGFYGKPRVPLRGRAADWAANQLPHTRSAITNILHAELEADNKTETLRFPDGRRTRLAQASSGQQEVLPLLLLLSRFALQPAKSTVGLHIEEPEAHLFPTTQREVVEIMAETFGLQERHMTLVITTHSPYILTAFNNLLQAGLRYASADKAMAKRLEAIVPRRRALRPGDVTAYALEGGGAMRIMDDDTHLIDAAMIDKVSNELAVEFDRLLWEE